MTPVVVKRPNRHMYESVSPLARHGGRGFSCCFGVSGVVRLRFRQFGAVFHELLSWFEIPGDMAGFAWSTRLVWRLRSGPPPADAAPSSSSSKGTGRGSLPAPGPPFVAARWGTRGPALPDVGAGSSKPGQDEARGLPLGGSRSFRPLHPSLPTGVEPVPAEAGELLAVKRDLDLPRRCPGHSSMSGFCGVSVKRSTGMMKTLKPRARFTASRTAMAAS